MNRPRVIVSRSPQKYLRLIYAALFVALLLLLIAAYELGQSNAGFNRLEALGDIASLDGELSDTSDEVRELRERLAILETAARVDKEAYALVENELVDLRSQIMELEENLAFYRGIVAPDDAKGVQVQELLLTSSGDKVRLRLFLTQALRSDKPISGQVSIEVAGIQDGALVLLPLAQLASDAGLKTPIRFRFRYFEEIAAELTVPEGFRPTEVRISARPDGQKAKTVEESFVWGVKAE